MTRRIAKKGEVALIQHQQILVLISAITPKLYGRYSHLVQSTEGAFWVESLEEAQELSKTLLKAREVNERVKQAKQVLLSCD